MAKFNLKSLILLCTFVAAIAGWAQHRSSYGDRSPQRDGAIYAHTNLVFTRNFLCEVKLTSIERDVLFRKAFSAVIRSSRAKDRIDKYAGNDGFCETKVAEILNCLEIFTYEEFLEVADRVNSGWEIEDDVYGLSSNPNIFITFIKECLQHGKSGVYRG